MFEEWYLCEVQWMDLELRQTVENIVCQLLPKIEVQSSARSETRRGVDGLAARLVARGNQYT